MRCYHCRIVGEPGRYVLLVEDDREIRDSLREILLCEGISVSTAANGEEALFHLARNPAPSLILLDLMMPVMSGAEFRAAQLLDPVLASVPVMLLSAGGELSQRADQLGASGFFSKPIDLPLLIATVQRYVAV
jgi:CheY-like chemotaxis protein